MQKLVLLRVHIHTFPDPTPIDLTTSEADTTGFVSIKELEATQVVQSTQVAQATQPKRRGRPPGSKDKVLVRGRRRQFQKFTAPNKPSQAGLNLVSNLVARALKLRR